MSTEDRELPRPSTIPITSFWPPRSTATRCGSTRSHARRRSSIRRDHAEEINCDVFFAPVYTRAGYSRKHHGSTSRLRRDPPVGGDGGVARCLRRCEDADGPCGSCGAQPAAKPPAASTQRVNANARALAEVRSRIAAYVGLHRELEATLPPLAKDATAEQIDKHQRALAHLLQQARKGAKPGDIFTPAGRSVIRRLVDVVLGGPDGAGLRDSIRDENPGSLSIAVNAATRGRSR